MPQSKLEDYLETMLEQGIDTHVIQAFRAADGQIKLRIAAAPISNERAAPIPPREENQLTPTVRRIGKPWNNEQTAPFSPEPIKKIKQEMKEEPKEEAYTSSLSLLS